MLKNLKFDYDPENDSLFMYDSKSKSKASIAMDSLIMDFNADGEISAIEILNATTFFQSLVTGDMVLDQTTLQEIKKCQIETLQKGNFHFIKFTLTLKTDISLVTPLMLPTISEPCPALSN
jgi:uncharacterized protein YuzE